MHNFQFSQEEFLAALKQEIRRGQVQNDQIDLDRLSVMNDVCSELRKIFPGVKAGVDMSPAFRTGHVIFRVQAVDFSGEQISILRSALSKCSAFEVSPLTNGNVDISFSVKGIYK